MGMFVNKQPDPITIAQPDLSAPLPMPATPMAPLDLTNARAPHLSFFGEGGIGRLIAGSIGDGLAQWGGMRPVFSAAMQQRQELARQTAEEQRRASLAMSQFVAQQQYKRLYPEPTDLEQRVQALNGLESGLGNTYAHNYAANGGGMPQLMNVPGYGVTSIPKQPATPSAPPQAAVDMLRSDPSKASQFDEVFGAGAAQRALGGAPSQGGATFPLR